MGNVKRAGGRVQRNAGTATFDEDFQAWLGFELLAFVADYDFLSFHSRKLRVLLYYCHQPWMLCVGITGAGR